MSNKQVLQKLDEMHDTRISKLCWIAFSVGETEMEEMLEDLLSYNKELQRLFPEIAALDCIEEAIEEKDHASLFFDRDILGLLAQVHISQPYNISYNEGGGVEGYTTSSTSRITYCYGETMGELFESIEKRSLEIFNEFIAEDKASNTHLPILK